MKKKILSILIIILLMLGIFFLGRQVGLNTEKSSTQIVTTQEKVSTQSIKKTLTSSGSVSSKETDGFIKLIGCSRCIGKTNSGLISLINIMPSIIPIVKPLPLNGIHKISHLKLLLKQ